MKYIFLLISFSCFATHSFAQKDEKLRFLIKDSEQTDSAYLKTIIHRIYNAALEGRIDAFNNPELSEFLSVAEIEKVGEFCETLEVPVGDGDDPYKDTVVCTPPDIPYSFQTFSMQYKNFNTFPKSIALEIGRIRLKVHKDQDFWINFNDLTSILTQKQITALLESTKYLPLIEDY